MAARLPESDKDYPVTLGETFQAEDTASYHSLQYNFKPQSAGRRRPGSFQLSQHSVSLQAPNAVEGLPDLGFEGQWAPAQEGLDCVALFDGNSWRLEKLSGMATNVRHTSSVPVQASKEQQSLKPQKGAPSRSPVAVQGKKVTAVKKSVTPSASAQYSTTPSFPAPSSQTPSVSRKTSTETSPSIADKSLSHSLQAAPQPPSPRPRTAATKEAAGVSEAGLPSRGSPSVPPPNSMLEVSTSSATSSEDGEEAVEQPNRTTQLQRASQPTKQRTDDRPNFEREFFQDNSSSSGGSQNDASESSRNESEEEAKHF